MQQVRLNQISSPALSPEVWCARLAPPWPALRWNPHRVQIQRLDLQKKPENHRRLTDSTEVVEMKRIP